MGRRRMRIVAGAWRGRSIFAPAGDATRPTSDRVREAVFSVLESRYPEQASGAVLDAFAGTGALGLEALSRGAAQAVLVERERAALATLRANVEALGADAATVVPADVFAAARGDRLPGGPFSLLLMDPPYRIERAQVRGLLAVLSEGRLARGAAVVWEHSADAPPDWPAGFEADLEKRYGDTIVSFARHVRGD